MSTTRPRSRAFRVTRWLIVNSIVAALFIAGASFGVTWAGNLARFTLWAFLPFAVIAVLGTAFMSYVASAPEIEPKAETREKILRNIAGLQMSVPHWLDAAYDLALVFYLAAVGWTASAVGMLALMLCSQTLFAVRASAEKRLQRLESERMANEFLNEIMSRIDMEGP